MDIYAAVPQYQSHKVVRAAEILEIEPHNGGAVLILDVPTNPGFNFVVTDEWLDRNPKLEVGGYFVIYERMSGETENYTAYSPAEAFEKGYTQVGSRVMPANPFSDETNLKLSCLYLGRDTCVGKDSDTVVAAATQYLAWLKE